MFIDTYFLLRNEITVLRKRYLLQVMHGVFLFVHIVMRIALTLTQILGTI